MHPEPMLIDAQHAGTQLHRWHAHRRLVDQVSPAHTGWHGLRYRIGTAMIAAGNRLQDVPPRLQESSFTARPIH